MCSLKHINSCKYHILHFWGAVLVFKSSCEKGGRSVFMERSVVAFQKHYHEDYISLLA